MELTNAIRRDVARLDKASQRRETGLFKAEGTKCVCDTLDHFEPVLLAATRTWIDEHRVQAQSAGDKLAVVSRRELEQMSSMKSVPDVLAVYRIPEPIIPSIEAEGLTLVLDTVQDPGNLGTILRTADWMGVRRVLCSPDTADIYSPKAVMSTMGALSRVEVCYCDLVPLLMQASVPVYGMALDGNDIYRTALSRDGVIVMGNEGRGLSPEVSATVTDRLLIPAYGEHSSESLNVAVATAITLAEFRRRESVGE